MDKLKLWQATLAQLQLSISRAEYSLWFTKTEIKNIKKESDRQTVQISCQNQYIADKLAKNYSGQIKEILDSLTKESNSLTFNVSKPIIKNTNQGPLFSFDSQKEKINLISQSLNRARINPECTFENFAVASTNEMAYAAATAVSNRPGKAYNPLFLYGGVGVGKTHLMQAVGITLLHREPQTSILYCTGEEFTNEIIEAIRGKTTGYFKRKFRNVNLLLIDDIQFIAGRATVQEEFFHTFNAIKQMGGQIVMTSDRLPEQIDGLEDRLRSRFEGGLTIDIQEPNFELRTAILLIKAKQMGEELPMEVAKLIATHVSSTRKLEGVLVRVISEKGLRKKQLDTDLVFSILKKTDTQNGQQPRSLATPDKIIKIVSDFYQLKSSDLKGTRRVKHIVLPRQISIYILRSDLKLPYQEIGRIFGGKDHTTIMHSEAKIKTMLLSNEKIKQELQQIRKNLF